MLTSPLTPQMIDLIKHCVQKLRKAYSISAKKAKESLKD